MNTPDTDHFTITAREVIEAERLNLLPRHFGRHMVRVEAAIFAFLQQLSLDYHGGYWTYYELSNGGMYMASATHERLRLLVDGNGFEGTVRATAAGIIACLFALSHLSFSLQHERITEHFYRLREFALGHPESRLIFAAID